MREVLLEWLWPASPWRRAATVLALSLLAAGHAYVVYYNLFPSPAQAKFVGDLWWASAACLLVLALPYVVGTLFVGRGFARTLAFDHATFAGGVLVAYVSAGMAILALNCAVRTSGLSVAWWEEISVLPMGLFLGCGGAFVGLPAFGAYLMALFGGGLYLGGGASQSYHCGRCGRPVNTWGIFLSGHTRRCRSCGVLNLYDPSAPVRRK